MQPQINHINPAYQTYISGTKGRKSGEDVVIENYTKLTD
jgi:hypothetical protein